MVEVTWELTVGQFGVGGGVDDHWLDHLKGTSHDSPSSSYSSFLLYNQYYFAKFLLNVTIFLFYAFLFVRVSMTTLPDQPWRGLTWLLLGFWLDNEHLRFKTSAHQTLTRSWESLQVLNRLFSIWSDPEAIKSLNKFNIVLELYILIWQCKNKYF